MWLSIFQVKVMSIEHSELYAKHITVSEAPLLILIDILVHRSISCNGFKQVLSSYRIRVLFSYFS